MWLSFFTSFYRRDPVISFVFRLFVHYGGGIQGEVIFSVARRYGGREGEKSNRN